MKDAVVKGPKAPEQGGVRRRLVILLADTPNPAVVSEYGDYHEIFVSLIRRALEAAGSAATIEVASYDAVGADYPDDNILRSAAGVLITGSGAWREPASGED